MLKQVVPWIYFGISRKHSNKMRGLWGVILFEKFPPKSNRITGKLLDRSKKKFCRWRWLQKKCLWSWLRQAGPGPARAWTQESSAFFRNMFNMVCSWIRLQNWDLDAPIPPNCAEFRSASDGTSPGGSRHNRKIKKKIKCFKLNPNIFSARNGPQNWAPDALLPPKCAEFRPGAFGPSPGTKKSKKVSKYAQTLLGT